MADVFISYARSDESVARRIVKGLQTAGFNVWWDAELPAHRPYSEVIERNLKDARVVVVLWSEAAARSEWVRAEADFARNARNLVQAQLDAALPPLPFNQIQCADLRGWRGGASHPGWAKLLSSVNALVSGEASTVPERRSNWWDRIRRYRWAAALAVGFLVAVGVWLFAIRGQTDDRKPVVAVLPFRSIDAQDESLVGGIWEDTRTAIGRNPQLVVLGPKTAQELARNDEKAVGKAADYLVEASVRTAGDKIRVSADLVRTKDGEQIWSQDFDRKLDDVFAIQSEIASEIEGHIRGRLAMKGGRSPEHIATTGEVYALYSDARRKITRRAGPEDMTAAHSELEQVVKLDPNFAPGWAALAQVIGEIPPSEKRWQMTESGEVYARRAISLAPNLAAAHAALAYTLRLQGPVARAELEKAVQLDPNDYEALNWLANMKQDAGDKAGAVQAYRRAAQIEPYFWPAVFNLYSALQELNDRAGMQELIEEETRVGADYFATAVKIDAAYNAGDLGNAANLGLTYWKNGRKEGRPPIAQTLWSVLIQLGYVDEAARLGPGPDFALYLWKLDPKGLDVMEAHHMDPHTFFALEPLTENASRLYLLSGRGKTLADMYLALKVKPEELLSLMTPGEDASHFILSAPLIAMALKQSGHTADAETLLSVAETKARAASADGKPQTAALLARVLAVQGRKEEALGLLSNAVNRNWIPPAPELLSDLHSDPALGGLKGDPRFEALRDRLLGTIARERAQISEPLLAQLRTG